MLAKFRAAGLIWPTVCTILAAALLVALGNWQWHRKAWKDNLIATIEARSAEPPLSFEQAQALRCDVAQTCEYRRVRVTGTFDHPQERHVFAGIPPGASEPGYWVFTPFSLAQGTPSRRPLSIAVNRGFVPQALKDQGQRLSGQISGDVDIVAQIRARENRGFLDVGNDASNNIYFVRDPVELGFRLPGSRGDQPWPASGSYYLELIAPTPPGGHPQPLTSQITIPNRHLEYALTWWGLALTLLGVYLAFAAGRLQQQPRGAT